jgi:amidase
MLTLEYEKYDALGLAALVNAGEVAPVELMQCAIELARSRGAALNALCYERFDDSLLLAKSVAPRGTFGALPFLLKDSALPARRFPSCLGSQLLKDITFKFDATLVERFERHGLLAFARTCVPEFCMAPTTEAAANGGPTLNPWDPTRSPGGSSGGAAVAVASAIVPLAHANDGGGSIRIPASCCGIYGLKPSRGLVPLGPARGEGWGGLAVEGVLSRSVRDTAAALDAIAGYEPGAPYASPARASSYLALLERPFERPLRIAQWAGTWNDVAVDAQCTVAVARAGALLRSFGHEVVETALPPIDYAAFVESLIDVLATNVYVTVKGAVGGRPAAEWRDRLEPALFDGYEVGKSITAERYVAAITMFHSVGRRIERHLATFDLALTPTLTQPPLPLGVLRTDTDFRSFRRAASSYTMFLAICNASGQPAASIPVHWTTSGLPIGVQLIGRFGGEDRILRLSAQLESVVRWGERRPSTLVRQSARA